MGKMRVLKFLAEARLDKNKQSDYRLDELHFQIKPEIKVDKLNIFLLDLQEKGLIKRSEGRQNAYRISNAGRIYYSSSFWSNLNANQKISIIGIIVGSILTFLGFYLKYNCNCA